MKGETDGAPSAEGLRLVRPRDAAQMLAISERKLWEISSPRGPVPCLRIGRVVRYDLADLRAWIESQKGRRRS